LLAAFIGGVIVGRGKTSAVFSSVSRKSALFCNSARCWFGEGGGLNGGALIGKSSNRLGF
jgi:hypothetical protein